MLILLVDYLSCIFLVFASSSLLQVIFSKIQVYGTWWRRRVLQKRNGVLYWVHIRIKRTTIIELEGLAPITRTSFYIVKYFK